MAYFAMLWSSQCERQCAEAERIIKRLAKHSAHMPPHIEREGVFLAELPPSRPASRCIQIGGRENTPAGAIFGDLFSSNTPGTPSQPVRRLDSAAARDIVSSGGASLIKKYWGSYIAFLNCGRNHLVIQDPTAGIPCYYMSRNGLTLLFSNIEACGFLDVSGLSIDTEFVSALLAYDKPLDGRTGLKEVSELLAGEALTRDPSGKLSLSTLWDPRSIARETPDLSDVEAEALLAATVRQCVAARASEFQEITVSLSGGLDSSIVLACLAVGYEPERLHAVHYKLGSGDEAEERFAAETARHCGCRLTTIPVIPAQAFPGPEDFPATVRPSRQRVAPDLPALLPPAHRRPGCAWFTGQGGDHLFHVARNPLIFADYVSQKGITSSTGSQLMAAARLSGLSIWEVLKLTLFPATRPPLAMMAGIQSRETRATRRHHQQSDIGERFPAWALQADGVPPAKFDQLSTLPHLFQLRDKPSLDPPEVVHPLISQPLIELCLQLPSWQLSRGGQSRGLVRSAFAGAIPDSVRTRMTKGYASRYYTERAAAHLETIRGALIGGELSKAGLLSDAETESLLTADRFRSEKSGSMLLVYYGIEGWLRAWSSRLSNASKRTGPAP